MTTAEIARADVGVPGVRIIDVRVGERARQDYGDLEKLKASIAEHGLLQPIVLLPDNYLLCGGRRLQACKELGWVSIPHMVSRTQTDAISRLRAERDENTCRKDMTPSELVAIGKKLEEMKRPEAEARQSDGGKKGMASRWNNSGAFAPELFQPHSTRREVADAVGMTESTYTRAKRVVEAAEDEAAPEPVRAAAVEARAEMDSGTSTVGAADRKIREAKEAASATGDWRVRLPEVERAEQIRLMADTGRTSGQIGSEIGLGEEQVRAVARRNQIVITADKLLAGTHRVRVDHNHIVNHLVSTLEGLTEGLDRVDLDALDDAQMQNWVDSLTITTRALNRFVKQMKEKIQ